MLVLPPVTDVILISPVQPPSHPMLIGLAAATETGSVWAKLKPVDLIESKSKESITQTVYEIFAGILMSFFVLADIRTPELSHL